MIRATFRRMADTMRPQDMVGTPLPDLTLPDDRGQPWPLRQHVGLRPLVLFFIIHSGTPG